MLKKRDGVWLYVALAILCLVVAVVIIVPAIPGRPGPQETQVCRSS